MILNGQIKFNGLNYNKIWSFDLPTNLMGIDVGLDYWQPNPAKKIKLLPPNSSDVRSKYAGGYTRKIVEDCPIVDYLSLIDNKVKSRKTVDWTEFYNQVYNQRIITKENSESDFVKKYNKMIADNFKK